MRATRTPGARPHERTYATSLLLHGVERGVVRESTTQVPQRLSTNLYVLRMTLLAICSMNIKWALTSNKRSLRAMMGAEADD